jgi:uncharacterized protein
MDINALFELDRLAGDDVRKFPQRRTVWDALVEMPGRPFVALVGPRGTGKTVLLRQLRIQHDDALYISADTLDRSDDLFEIVNTLHQSYGINRFFIDEIHFVGAFAGSLKRVFDFLPVAIVFTSSVAAALASSAWDLARRVTTVRLWPFSFREYLWFTGGPRLEPLGIATLLGDQLPREYLRAGSTFSTYLAGGLYPFMLQPGTDVSLFASILTKIIESDIPSVHPDVSVEEIRRIHDVVRFVGRAGIDGVNYSTLSKNVGITKYKAEQYLAYLEECFVVHRVMPRGTNVLKEPKVMLQLPFRVLYRPPDEAIGALREEFFVLAMRMHGCAFDYLKSTRGAKTPDYLITVDGTDVVVEIGGAGKGRSQFKDVTYDRKLVLYDDPTGSGRISPGARLPLFLLGFS